MEARWSCTRGWQVVTVKTNHVHHYFNPEGTTLSPSAVTTTSQHYEEADPHDEGGGARRTFKIKALSVSRCFKYQLAAAVHRALLSCSSSNQPFYKYLSPWIESNEGVSEVTEEGKQEKTLWIKCCIWNVVLLCRGHSPVTQLLWTSLFFLPWAIKFFSNFCRNSRYSRSSEVSASSPTTAFMAWTSLPMA